jgi:hypothetical protein
MTVLTLRQDGADIDVALLPTDTALFREALGLADDL